LVASDGANIHAGLLKACPQKTVCIGRIRPIAVLNALPGQTAATSRPRRSMARRSSPRNAYAPRTPWPGKASRLLRQAKNPV
jgi:hypothetical protein